MSRDEQELAQLLEPPAKSLFTSGRCLRNSSETHRSSVRGNQPPCQEGMAENWNEMEDFQGGEGKPELGEPLTGMAKGPLLCCPHPALLLAGFGHQGTEPTMLHPSLRTSLWLLILTGECSVCLCRTGPFMEMLGRGAEGSQCAPGTSVPRNDSGLGAHADTDLWQGGCKVPTCFRPMGGRRRPSQRERCQVHSALSGYLRTPISWTLWTPPHQAGFSQTSYKW